MWFQAPSHIYSKVKVNSYLKICVLEGVQKIYLVSLLYITGAHSGTVASGTVLQAERCPRNFSLT